MPDEEAVANLGAVGLERMTEIARADMRDLRVSYDNWFTERSLFANGQYDRAMKLLDEAGAKFDVDERRKVVAKLEKIIQEDAIISQDFWRSVFTAAHERVHGIYAQVALEHHYNKVWIG